MRWKADPGRINVLEEVRRNGSQRAALRQERPLGVSLQGEWEFGQPSF
jgi:hypothetical protein